MKYLLVLKMWPWLHKDKNFNFSNGGSDFFPFFSLTHTIKLSSGWTWMIFVNDSAVWLLCSVNVRIVIDLWVHLLKGCKTVSMTPFVTQQFHSLIKLKVLLVSLPYFLNLIVDFLSFCVARQKNTNNSTYLRA